MTNQTQVRTVEFFNVESLYEDMVTSNQSFIKSENEYQNNKPLIEGSTIYRKVELNKGKLEFHSNSFGGSNLHIVGKIISAQKIYSQDNSLSEYCLSIEGKDTPLTLLSFKK